MSIKQFSSRTALIEALSAIIIKELQGDIDANDHASLAVPGGSTPGPIFDHLSQSELNWEKITVLPDDDRCVPETSEHSNAAQIKSRLLKDNAANAHFIPLYTGIETNNVPPAQEAELANLGQLTTVLLGMGGDMHTASLFPGDQILAAHSSKILHYVPVPGMAPKVPRISLTHSAINAARSRHLVLFGQAKLSAYQKAMELGDPVKAPISAIKDLHVYWAD